MKNTWHQFLHLGLTSCLISLGVSSSYAKGYSEEPSFNSNACLISIEDEDGLKKINTQYIKGLMIQKEKKDTVAIVTTANQGVSNEFYGVFRLKYATPELAKQAYETISDQIVYCREDALEKRKTRKIK